MGASYIPDGIYPAVPLCGDGPHNCLFGTREREEVMFCALRVAFCNADSLDDDLFGMLGGGSGSGTGSSGAADSGGLDISKYISSNS